MGNGRQIHGEITRKLRARMGTKVRWATVIKYIEKSQANSEGEREQTNPCATVVKYIGKLHPNSKRVRERTDRWATVFKYIVKIQAKS